jgi:hypothetical protein
MGRLGGTSEMWGEGTGWGEFTAYPSLSLLLALTNKTHAQFF